MPAYGHFSFIRPDGSSFIRGGTSLTEVVEDVEFAREYGRYMTTFRVAYHPELFKGINLNWRIINRSRGYRIVGFALPETFPGMISIDGVAT